MNPDNIPKEIRQREPGCTCNFDYSGEPLIGGYARCSVHSPDKYNQSEFENILKPKLMEVPEDVRQKIEDMFPYQKSTLQASANAYILMQRDAALKAYSLSQAELKEKEAEIDTLKKVVKNSGFHFWAKTKGWTWHQNGYFYQLDYRDQWPAPRVKEDYELRPEFEKEYGLENIYFNPDGRYC